MEPILFVVAHPDDEVLGGGGLLGTLADKGHLVTACILSSVAAARDRRPQDHELLEDTLAASKTLGMHAPILGDFPNIKLNVVPHIELVQFIEDAIVSTGATQIFTHHPGDLNDDHRKVSAACQAAARLPLRRDGLPKLQGLHFMEVPSSTDWAFPGAGPAFTPNSFFELGEADLARKLNALHCYRDIMRPMPHPRSIEAVRGLAAVRGGQAGMIYAEAFQSVFTNLGYL
ncbi:MAG: PIG-L family deacetylase [Cellulomonas sp.]|nr:PIG-L family deacetylase [Cellulomonas sp.]